MLFIHRNNPLTASPVLTRNTRIELLQKVIALEMNISAPIQAAVGSRLRLLADAIQEVQRLVKHMAAATYPSFDVFELISSALYLVFLHETARHPQICITAVTKWTICAQDRHVQVQRYVTLYNLRTTHSTSGCRKSSVSSFGPTFSTQRKSQLIIRPNWGHPEYHTSQPPIVLYMQELQPQVEVHA